MRSLVVLFSVVAAAFAAPRVLEKRSLGHGIAYSLAPAVSHQSRLDIHSSPALIAAAPAPVYTPIIAEPVLETRTALLPGPTIYAGGSAVSHQSRVDVQSSPAIIAAAPALASEGVIVEPAARALYTAPALIEAPAAVSHQSRYDVRSSPAIISEQYVQPLTFGAHSLLAPSLYASGW